MFRPTSRSSSGLSSSLSIRWVLRVWLVLWCCTFGFLLVLNKIGYMFRPTIRSSSGLSSSLSIRWVLRVWLVLWCCTFWTALFWLWLTWFCSFGRVIAKSAVQIDNDTKEPPDEDSTNATKTYKSHRTNHTRSTHLIDNDEDRPEDDLLVGRNM
jgi:hypothetical protein